MDVTPQAETVVRKMLQEVEPNSENIEAAIQLLKAIPHSLNIKGIQEIDPRYENSQSYKIIFETKAKTIESYYDLQRGYYAKTGKYGAKSYQNEPALAENTIASYYNWIKTHSLQQEDIDYAPLQSSPKIKPSIANSIIRDLLKMANVIALEEARK